MLLYLYHRGCLPKPTAHLLYEYISNKLPKSFWQTYEYSMARQNLVLVKYLKDVKQRLLTSSQPIQPCSSLTYY